MRRYRVSFIIDMDDEALWKADNEAEDQCVLNPMWIAGKAAEEALHEKYGINAKLVGWEFTGHGGTA